MKNVEHAPTYPVEGLVIESIDIELAIVLIPDKFRFREADELTQEIGVFIATNVNVLQLLDELRRNCGKRGEKNNNYF